jgi:hypothetical protein
LNDDETSSTRDGLATQPYRESTVGNWPGDKDLLDGGASGSTYPQQ